ncbi:MAG: RHS repeat protein, partial [Planctomycetales bacterium]|nr:RHS repeat protein [Planctomycetales bacterium]
SATSALLSRQIWGSNPSSPEREATYEYDGRGQVKSVLLGSSVYYDPILISTAQSQMWAGTTQPVTTSITYPTSTLQKLAYTDPQNQTITDFGENLVVQYTLDQFGRMLRRGTYVGAAVTPLSEEAWERDHFGNVIAYTDELGRVTYFAYDYETVPADPDQNSASLDPDDYRGNIVAITDVSGTLLFEYETDDGNGDAVGRLMRSVDQRDVETIFERDSFGRILTRRIVRDGIDTSASPGAADYFEQWEYYDNTSPFEGLLKSYTNPLGLLIEYVDYDANRRLVESRTTDQGIDLGGTIDDEIQVTTFTYDAFGNLNRTTLYEGTVAAANEISETDYDFDQTGLLRRLTVLSPDDAQLSYNSFNYDANGTRTAVIDGLGAISTTEYNTAGQLTQTVLASGATYTAHFTGQAESIEQTTSYGYYNDGSLKSIELPDGTQQLYFYDPIGRKDWVSTNGVAGKSTINPDDSLSIQLDQLHVLRTTYDVAGRVIEEHDLLKGSNTTYAYQDHRVDLPTQVSRLFVSLQPNYLESQKTVIRYDAVGNVIFSQSGAGAAVRTEYDELGYASTSKVLAYSGAQVEFTTNPLGQVVEQDEIRFTGSNSATITTSYEYDEQGRLRKLIDPLTDGQGTDETGATPATVDYAFANDLSFPDGTSRDVRVVRS